MSDKKETCADCGKPAVARLHSGVYLCESHAIGWGENNKALRAEITRLQAELSALREATAWRPIETAPKEEVVLLYCDVSDEFINGVCVGVFGRYFHSSPKAWVSAHHTKPVLLKPTHWQPLPTPPAKAEEGLADAV